MGRVLLALFALVGLIIVIAYLNSAPYTTTATTATQHTVVGNHTNVVVNLPPDYTGIALIIIAVAVLVYVIFSVAIPAIRDWRRGT